MTGDPGTDGPLTGGPAPRRGPRPGEDTRGAILEAARTEFARAGYAGASLRGIARVAGVDPALVHHYFDGKADLFAESVVALSLPYAPQQIVRGVLDGPREEVGRRGVAGFLAVWDSQGDTFVALVRSVVQQEEEVVRGVREFLGREIFGRVARGVDPAAPEEEVTLRGSLAASQMLGLAIARYVMRLPGVVDAAPEELVERVGPALQRHLLPEG